MRNKLFPRGFSLIAQNLCFVAGVSVYSISRNKLKSKFADKILTLFIKPNYIFLYKQQRFKNSKSFQRNLVKKQCFKEKQSTRYINIHAIQNIDTITSSINI